MENNDNRITESADKEITLKIKLPQFLSPKLSRPIIPTFYLLAGVMFFFTFCDINCGEVNLVKIKGTDLLVGKDLGKSAPLMDDVVDDTKKLKPNPLVIFPFVISILGISLYFIQFKFDGIISFILAFLATVSLIVFRFSLLHEMSKQEMASVINVKFKFAYWAAILCFLFVAVMSIVNQLSKKKAEATEATYSTEENA